MTTILVNAGMELFAMPLLVDGVVTMMKTITYSLRAFVSPLVMSVMGSITIVTSKHNFCITKE